MDEVFVGESECNALTQSYVQGVERVAQQNNKDVGFKFNLPKEVIEGREKAWGSLFDKYTNEMTNDVELNIETMQPVAEVENNKDEEDNEDDEGEDADKEEDEVEDKQYYSKCRAPIRKLPALIQYWIDTGNPPYQLFVEDDNSEMGSSLSEAEYSRAGGSPALQEAAGNLKVGENSPCTSVDTVAYVLSNANVTNKITTMGIIESSRRVEKPSESPTEKDKNLSPSTRDSCHHRKDRISNQIDGVRSSYELDKNKNSKNVEKEESLSQSMQEQVERAKITQNINVMNSPVSQCSTVLLSEVIPALQQFDLVETTSIAKKPRSPLSKVRIRKPTIVVKKTSGQETTVTSQNSCSSPEIVENSKRTTKSLGGRRILYTGRNSPIDLNFTRSSFIVPATVTESLHPALMPMKNSKNNLGRVRIKRKRKRTLRQSSNVQKTDIENSSQSDSKLVDDFRNNNSSKDKDFEENEPKGDERYVGFFESLGLTPRKMIAEGNINDSNTPRKRILPEATESRQEALEISMEETQESSGTNFPKSSIERTQESSKEFLSKVEENSRIPETSKVLEDKILRVKLEKLSDKTLSIYKRRKHLSKIDRLANCRTSNIELITTTTHDSDSTIFLYPCDPKSRDSSEHSEYSSLITDSIPERNNSNSKNPDDFSNSRSLIMNENVKNFENGRKLFVRLERLRECTNDAKTRSDPVPAKRRIRLTENFKRKSTIMSRKPVPLNSEAKKKKIVTDDSQGMENSFRMKILDRRQRRRDESSDRTLSENEKFSDFVQNVQTRERGKNKRKPRLSVGKHSEKAFQEEQSNSKPFTHFSNLRVVSTDEEDETSSRSSHNLRKISKKKVEMPKKKSKKEIIDELMRDLTRTDEPQFVEQFAELRGIEKRTRRKRRIIKSAESSQSAAESPKTKVSVFKNGRFNAKGDPDPTQRKKRNIRLTTNARSRIIDESSDSSGNITIGVRSKKVEENGKLGSDILTRNSKKVVEKLERDSANVNGFSNSIDTESSLEEKSSEVPIMMGNENYLQSPKTSSEEKKKIKSRSKATEKKAKIRLTKAHWSPIECESDDSEERKKIKGESKVSIDKGIRKGVLSKRKAFGVKDFFSIATDDSMDNVDFIFDESPRKLRINSTSAPKCSNK